MVCTIAVPPYAWAVQVRDGADTVGVRSTPTHVGCSTPRTSPPRTRTQYSHERGLFNLSGMPGWLIDAVPPRTWGRFANVAAMRSVRSAVPPRAWTAPCRAHRHQMERRTTSTCVDGSTTVRSRNCPRTHYSTRVGGFLGDLEFTVRGSCLSACCPQWIVGVVFFTGVNVVAPATPLPRA